MLPTIVVNIRDAEDVAVIDIPRDYLASHLWEQNNNAARNIDNNNSVSQLIEELQHNEILAEILQGKENTKFFTFLFAD